MKCLFIISSAIILFWGCLNNKNSTNELLLQESKFIEVLVDVHLAEASVFERKLIDSLSSELLKKHYDLIFSIHGITSEELEFTYDYYQKDPVVFNSLYDKVLEQLRIEEENFHLNN